MDLRQLRDVLRLRPPEPQCFECLRYYTRAMANLVRLERDSRSDYIKGTGIIELRVSCEKSLEKKRSCAIMGHEGYIFSLTMDGVTSLRQGHCEPYLVGEMV